MTRSYRTLSGRPATRYFNAEDACWRALNSKPMIAGLRRMSQVQLQHLVHLAGGGTAADGSVEGLTGSLVELLGRVVGAPELTPETIERAIIKFLADAWSVPYEANEPLSDIEDRVFLHLSEQGAYHLLPTWRVAAVMAALGRPAAHDTEVLFLERVGDKLIAHERARSVMVREWETFSNDKLGCTQALARLEEDLKTLRHHTHLVRPTLDLCMVVALSDGTLEPDETAWFRAVAKALHVPPVEAELMEANISRIFWRHLDAVSRVDRIEPQQVRRAAFLAAYATLEELGTVEGLEQEILHGEFTGLHALLTDPDFHHGVEGWRRRGFLWPLGFVAGFGEYLKARLQHKTHHHVAAVAYLAYAHEKEALLIDCDT